MAVSYMWVEEKDQSIQNAIEQAIAAAIAKEIAQAIVALMASLIWGTWDPPKRIDETTDEDLDGLTLEELKSWSSWVVANYPQ